VSIAVLAILPSAPAFAGGAYPSPPGFSNSRTLRLDYQSTFARASTAPTSSTRLRPYRTCTCTIWDRMRAEIFDGHRAVLPFFELKSRVLSLATPASAIL